MEFNWITLIDKEGRLYDVLKKDRQLYTDREATFEEIEKEETINNLNGELEYLKNWYNTEYTKLEQKYRRLNTLKVLTDSGLDPLGCLIDLYQEAENKRKRIQELEVLLVK